MNDDQLRDLLVNSNGDDRYPPSLCNAVTAMSDDNNLLRVQNSELLAALERTSYALELAFSQKPLRDMAETLAEARAAIAKCAGN